MSQPDSGTQSLTLGEQCWATATGLPSLQDAESVVMGQLWGRRRTGVGTHAQRIENIPSSLYTNGIANTGLCFPFHCSK